MSFKYIAKLSNYFEIIISEDDKHFRGNIYKKDGSLIRTFYQFNRADALNTCIQWLETHYHSSIVSSETIVKRIRE
jgi:hypothetical protein